MADHRSSILIAVSSKLARVKLVQALEESSTLFYEAHDIDELLEMTERFHPRLVCMDLRFSELPSTTVISRFELMENRPKLVLIGQENRLDDQYLEKGIDAFLIQPFHPEIAIFKLNTLMGNDTSAIERKKIFTEARRFKRISVNQVFLKIYRPVQEQANVEDLSQSGLKIISEKLEKDHINEDLKMQLVASKMVLNVGGRIVWVRDGKAGILITQKPPEFKQMFERILESSFG